VSAAPDRDPTAIRDALILPAIFLTVALLGGFRTLPGNAGLRFHSPPLMTLVLATLLLSVLAGSRVLVLHRLMNAGRSALENLTGAAILCSLFAAAAQLFNLVTPEGGVLRVVFDIVFFVLLANTAAAAPDRRRVLRSLVVVFGSAFVLKFLVIGTLQAHDGGAWYRMVAALFEGATLGAFVYAESGSLTGYVAFFTIALFVAGLVLLPHDELDGMLVRRDVIDVGQSLDSVQ
jgi:hypothetical protein